MFYNLLLFLCRQTFTKKKLNNSVSFPDTLDMNDYVDLENKKDGIYKLNAVLIHRGLSANSGHYIAHIWDEEVSSQSVLILS